MSEVSKKKKKRHHSISSNDCEAPRKRIKVEVNDTADDSIVLSAPGFDRNASDVEHRQKKKHKHHHSSEVDVDITGEDNVELSWTRTSCEYNATDNTVDHQTYETEHKRSSHKRLKHGKQQDSPLQQQSLANSSQTVHQVCPPDLRFLWPAGFVEVHLNSSNIWWEDVAGNEHKEVWLVRAPADCTASTLEHCSAIIGKNVQFSRNEDDAYTIVLEEPGNHKGGLAVLLPSKCDHRYRFASPIHSFVTVTKNIVRKPDAEKGSKSHKKKKKHKHEKHERTEHVDRNS